MLVAAVLVMGVGTGGRAAAKEPGHTFEMRPVVADAGAPVEEVLRACRAREEDTPCGVFPSRPGLDGYYLGPPVLDGHDVRSAQVRDNDGWVVLLRLTARGTRRFNDAALAQYGQPSPKDQVALVVDDVVQSAPAFQTPHYDGLIEISANFTKSEAQSVARAIAASRQ